MSKRCSIYYLMVSTLVIFSFACDRSDKEQTSDKPPNQSGPAPVATLSKPATAAREGWPTEEEAKAAIFKVEYEINASETNKSVWHVKDFRHEVKSVQFANETTQKQMKYGAAAQTVYPVKILYTQITEYTSKPETRVDCGSDGVWFLYKDSFGKWVGKYGKE